jgi:predicted metal-dependent hydrolase
MSKEQGEHCIAFGSETIAFSLTYQERKTLGITVHPDRSVSVKAPTGAEWEKIESKIRKRAPWILKQQSYFLSFEPRTPPRRYVSGESHLYLGRQYRLKVYERPGEASVKLKRGFLEVFTPDKNDTERLVKAWYKKRAEIQFPAIAEKWVQRFEKYKVSPTSTVIKWMDKRWGSCTPAGKIILNVELVKAPKGCISYVVLHELCHLLHPNHSAAFYELQTREMPDWRRWKERLEGVLA